MNIEKLTDMFIVSGELQELAQLEEEVKGLTDSQLVALYRHCGAEIRSGSEFAVQELIAPMASALAAAMELVRRGKGSLLDCKE
jgi:hypothetical protein